jgi:tetratricopeptide (TPR) repeat protein
MGVIYNELTEYNKALKYLSKAVALDSNNLDAHFLLGCIYSILENQI